MLLVATFIAVALGILIAILTTNPPTQEEIDRGARRYERELDRCLSGNYGRPDEAGFDSLEAMCAEFVQPQYYGPSTPRFSEIEEILVGTGFIVLLLGAVVGATLGGADWSAGSMATLLVWEPRRVRVLLARIVAVALTALVLTIVAQAVFVAGLTVYIAVHGTFDGTPAGYLGDLTSTVVRISAVAGLFALMGLSLATIGRSTVAGLGVFLGYLIIVEGFLSNLLFWVQKIDLRPCGGGRRHRGDHRAGRRVDAPAQHLRADPRTRVGDPRGVGGRAAAARRRELPRPRRDVTG